MSRYEVAHNQSTAEPATYTPEEWRMMAEASACTDESLTEYDLNRDPLGVISDDTPMTLRLKILNQELTCVVCLSIINDTRVVGGCLHRFCNECITKSLRTGKKECPTCREPCASARKLRKDRRFDEIIRQFYPDVEAYEDEQDRIIERINANINAHAFQEQFEEQLAAQKRHTSLLPSPPSFPAEIIYDSPSPPPMTMPSIQNPISKKPKITLTPQPPRRGPGRPPKKRGPGRPPKKRPEELPDYCPEFLDQSLFVDTKVTKNVKRLELVYHFQHIDAHHTRDPSSNEDPKIIDLPQQITPRMTQTHLYVDIRSRKKELQFLIAIASDADARAVMDHIRTSIPKCKSVHLYKQQTGGSAIRPNELLSDIVQGNKPLYFEHK